MNIICKFSLTLLLALPILAYSCSKDDETKIDDHPTGKTGTFSIDGVSYTGETSIQDNPSAGYYIVTCQSDEPYAFVQISFLSKEEAEKGGTFEVENYKLKQSSGKVQLGTNKIITSDPEADYTISVSGKKITLSNVRLVSTSSSSQKTTVNSASINF